MTSVLHNRRSSMSYYRSSHNTGSYNTSIKSSGYGQRSYSPKDYSSSKVSSSSRLQTNNSNIREISRNHVSSRTSEYESRSRPISGSRPLPPGPGPLDAYNKPVGISEATSKLKSYTTKSRPSDHRSPVKGNHDILPISSSSSSISNGAINNSYNYRTYESKGQSSSYKTGSTSLTRRRDYSSTSSLNSECNSVKEEFHDLNLSNDSKISSKYYNSTNKQPLPDIKDPSSSHYGGGGSNQQRSRRDSSLSTDSDSERPRRSSSANRLGNSSNSRTLNSESNVSTSLDIYNGNRLNNYLYVICDWKLLFFWFIAF